MNKVSKDKIFKAVNAFEEAVKIWSFQDDRGYIQSEINTAFREYQKTKKELLEMINTLYPQKTPRPESGRG